MPNEQIPKSILDEILENMLERLSGREEFDSAVMDGLRGVIASGAMAKPKKITEVIKFTSEAQS